MGKVAQVIEESEQDEEESDHEERSEKKFKLNLE